MKYIFTFTMLCFSSIALHGEEVVNELKEVDPVYQNEAKLPEGWSAPNSYNEVVEKSFPAYRAAYTSGSWRNFAFMRLFKHIQRNGIPMTAPVEMDLTKDGDKLKMTSMGFLYQNTQVGDLGNDGERVEVKDLPAMKALSYTWQGKNSVSNQKQAMQALELELVKRVIKERDYRLLGYNGPGVPESKKTWEMIVVLAHKK